MPSFRVKMYYTYAYLRDNKTPYYIGKGKNNRAFDKSRKGIKPPKNKNKIIILKSNLTEEEAFKHEIYMIAIFGRKDLRTGILHNKTDGGEGSSGWKATPELRKRLSEYRKGRKKKPLSKETKEKLRKVNLGKRHTEQSKLKMSLSRKGKKHKPHSEEAKIKMSKSKKGVFDGQNNPMYAKIHNEETKKLMSQKAKIDRKNRYSKFYEFTSPSGEKIVECTTIKDFCEKFNLRPDCLRRVVLGQRKTHKGWMAKECNGRKTTV